MEVNVEQSTKLASFLGIEDFRPGVSYKTGDLLGVGSTGLGVFKAYDKSSKKEYAVKVYKIRRDYAEYALRATRPAADGTVQGYVREFRQILKLKHDNIVKYFFADVRSITNTDGQQYQLCIFMERCMGKTLLRDMDSVYHRNNTGYKASEVRQYFVDVASGLRYLHESHRIVHRDLRPGNLIFAETDKKRLKIADYSASGALQDSVTMPGEGTTRGGEPPKYRAPEIVNDKFGQSGLRSDVWSLACILIFMLQGKPPVFPYMHKQHKFVADSMLEVVEALGQAAQPDIDGDFNRKTTYRDEGAFLNLAKDLLKQCLLANSEKRPYINAVCDHQFISSSDFLSDNAELETMQSNIKVLADDSTVALLKKAPLSTVVFNGETFGCSVCQYSYSYNDYIARGTFGTVFQAVITNRGEFCGAEPVAVKVVHLNRQSESQVVRANWTKLRRRLENVLEFSHDHLVKFHKITISQGSLGGISIELMMDYYNGGDLKTLIRNLRQRRDLLSEAAAVAYTIEIAEGLGFLHDRQIIHGDLKPSNILTTLHANGTRKLAICDLDDIVAMERDVTCSKDITYLRGTERYMSPEMLKKFVIEGFENPGRKTDMWSLGCIMLELADCVVGNDRKWLSKGLEKVEVGDKVNDQKFVQLIVDGYVPFPVQTIPSYIAASLQQCVCASAERISARVLIQQLKHETSLGASLEPAVARIERFEREGWET